MQGGKWKVVKIGEKIWRRRAVRKTKVQQQRVVKIWESWGDHSTISQQSVGSSPRGTHIEAEMMPQSCYGMEATPILPDVGNGGLARARGNPVCGCRYRCMVLAAYLANRHMELTGLCTSWSSLSVKEGERYFWLTWQGGSREEG